MRLADLAAAKVNLTSHVTTPSKLSSYTRYVHDISVTRGTVSEHRDVCLCGYLCELELVSRRRSTVVCRDAAGAIIKVHLTIHQPLIYCVLILKICVVSAYRVLSVRLAFDSLVLHLDILACAFVYVHIQWHKHLECSEYRDLRKLRPHLRCISVFRTAGQVGSKPGSNDDVERWSPAVSCWCSTLCFQGEALPPVTTRQMTRSPCLK